MFLEQSVQALCLGKKEFIRKKNEIQIVETGMKCSSYEVF